MVLVGSCSGGDGQTVTAPQVFTSRLRGRPLLDSEGLTIGRIRDVVLLPAAGTEPPRALGLVVTLQRRRIFVNLGAITEISVDGAHLRGGTVDLDRFTRRTGEILASELHGKQTQDGTVVDVAIIQQPPQYRPRKIVAVPIAPLGQACHDLCARQPLEVEHDLRFTHR